MLNNLIVIFFFLISQISNAQITKHSEKEIANYIQHLIGGEREVSVTSGRIDLVCGERAFEIEWANKWKEAIGQSLWYALQTNKKAGIILILRNRKDYKYLIQLNTTIQYGNLQNKIDVFIYPDDFQKYIK